MWPAVREAARRILREDSLIIRTPVRFVEDLDRLILLMGDAQPSRLSFPSVIEVNAPWIDVEQRNEAPTESTHLARLGPKEPGVDVCWIPLATDDAWAAIFEACEDLLEAGYPGCVGCGGPNSELPWDEKKFRQSWSSAR